MALQEARACHLRGNAADFVVDGESLKVLIRIIVRPVNYFI
jgi:uncharacterized protein YcbK (DUF882 family)